MPKTIVPKMGVALRLYTGEASGIALSNADIAELFGCSMSTVTRLKAPVIEEQKRRGVGEIIKSTVNTKIAFEAWGIDIAELERRYLKGQKLWRNVC